MPEKTENAMPRSDLDSEPPSNSKGLDPAAAEQGYVFDPASGFHWHPYAEHWYQPAQEIYLDRDGAPLDPAVARAEVAASIARGDGLPEEDEVFEEAEFEGVEVEAETSAAPASAAFAPPLPPEPNGSADDAAPSLAETIDFEMEGLELGTEPLDVAAPPLAEAIDFEMESLDVAAPPLAEAIDFDAGLAFGSLAEETEAPALDVPPEWRPESLDSKAGHPAAMLTPDAGNLGTLRKGLRVVNDRIVRDDGDEAPSEELPSLEEAYADPGRIPTRFGESQRVVVHLQSGAVKRGTMNGGDLLAASIELETPSGTTAIETEGIKAVFFMREPMADVPAPQGRKVQLTLSDGRRLEGFAPNPLPSSGGFYLLPVDTRANTSWIYVYPRAIRDLDLA